jgi:hypothetical protein
MVVVECPACGDPIVLTASASLGEPDGDGQVVSLVDVDKTPIADHFEQHVRDVQ